MTNKELLKLAYKASGYNFETKGWVSIDYDEPQIDYIKNTWWESGREYHDLWDPLTDDGDALRLAVKLRIDLEFLANGKTVALPKNHHRQIENVLVETNKDDPCVATRRAIVRAAAEIGRSMG